MIKTNRQAILDFFGVFLLMSQKPLFSIWSNSGAKNGKMFTKRSIKN